MEDAEKAHQLGSVVTRITEQAMFIVIDTAPGEGLHRVALSIGTLGDTKKASIKTPDPFKVVNQNQRL